MSAFDSARAFEKFVSDNEPSDANCIEYERLKMAVIMSLPDMLREHDLALAKIATLKPAQYGL